MKKPEFQKIISITVQALPESEKTRVLDWIQAVHRIKASYGSAKEKRKQLSELPAIPELLFEVAKNHLADFAESKSISTKENAKTVLNGATALIGPRRLVYLGILNFGLNLLSPRMLLLKRSDRILRTIETAIIANTTPPK